VEKEGGRVRGREREREIDKIGEQIDRYTEDLRFFFFFFS